MLTKTDLQKLYDSLPPISRREPSEDLIDLAYQLKVLEEETETSAAATDIWHQLILLCQAQLKELQPQQPTAASLYHQDYYAWVKEQIRLLHLRQFHQLDLEHLPDELNTLAWLVQREIETNLEIVCNHLLKYKYAREYLNDEPCCSSWRSALWMARNTIADALKESPTLRNYPAEELDLRYKLATSQVYQETKLPNGTLPQNCPWTIDRVLSQDWLPAEGETA